MKVIRLSEFMKMPSGTFYAIGHTHRQYDGTITGPACFDGLKIKRENALQNDWYQQEIDLPMETQNGDSYEDMWTNRTSIPMGDDWIGRYGGCGKDELGFLVYEKDDLLMLRSWIDEAIVVADQIVPAADGQGE